MPDNESYKFYVSALNEVDINFVRPISEIASDLIAFELLLIKWQRIQNLVSRETLKDIWVRHFYDSLQILPYIDINQINLTDMGSGGGFPAIPLAIAFGKGKKNFHLIESNRRKVSFLRTVSRELDLGVWVHDCRIEDVNLSDLGEVDLITSRATSSLDSLLALAYPFWAKHTHALLHKGAESSVELEEARVNWQFNVISMPSKTNDTGVVMDISNLSRKKL